MTMMKQLSISKRRWLALGVVGLLFGLVWSLFGQVEPVAALPPRVTNTPAPNEPSVGYIVLQTSAALKAKIGWTAIQWQDGLGRWNGGDSWQGTLEDGQKTWAVMTTDLGKGPFRWVAYDKPNGKVLATSASFFLPKSINESVIVPIK